MKIINDLDIEKYPCLIKFMDLTKLLDFIMTGAFHFTRLDHFEDKLEAISQRQLVKYFEHQIKLPFSLIKELPIEKRQKFYFASCWFAASRESVGMWNLYSNSDSIALRFNADDFITMWKNELIKVTPSRNRIDRIYINSVEYKNYLEKKDALSFKDENKIIGFHKDKSFEHEKEVRVLIKMITVKRIGNNIETLEDSPVDFYKIKYKNIKLIPFEIIFHPKMQNWKKENIETILFKYGFKNVKCKNSELEKMLN